MVIHTFSVLTYVCTLPPSCADYLEIWEPQPAGSLSACPGIALSNVRVHIILLNFMSLIRISWSSRKKWNTHKPHKKWRQSHTILTLYLVGENSRRVSCWVTLLNRCDLQQWDAYGRIFVQIYRYWGGGGLEFMVVQCEFTSVSL